MKINLNISNNKFNKINTYLILLSAILIFNNFQILAKSTYSSQRIKSAIENLILEKVNGQAVIEFVAEPRTCEFEQDEVDADILLTDEIKPGFNIIALKFTNNGKLLKYFEISVRVKLIQEVWVTSRKISANTILSEKDFVLKEKSINSNLQLQDISYLIGKQLTRFVPQDEVVTKEMLASEVLIKRSEKVTLIVESGAIRVRCIGTAIQDGAEGQLIRVKRDGSTTVLTGKVSPNGEVVIYSNNLSLN
jgi:flagella basal body P-ring formation protein FlgA